MIIPAPTLKYAGAKWRIAEWLCGHLPEHSSYVKPFFGSGAIYFNKPVASIEIINDLDQNVYNYFWCLREFPHELAQLCALTPWSQTEYEQSVLELQTPLNFTASDTRQRLAQARTFVTASWQMFGRKNVIARNGWRFRYLSSQSPLATWNKLPDRILHAASRLMHTQICCDPAADVIAGVNDKEVLVYADPPYLGSTRTYGKIYEIEMKSAQQHADLLEQLDAHIGMVVLSGYHSNLYNERLRFWTRFETEVRVQSNAHRTEVIWLNPLAAKRLGKPTQAQFFESGTV